MVLARNMKLDLLVYMAIVATATALPQTSSHVPTTFTVAAHRTGSSIDGLPWEANNLGFVLGGQPTTFCPSDIVPDCPPGVVTAITGLNNMDVEVPGGQQMFVEPSGLVGYTQPHSASIPPGSLTTGFDLVADGPGRASYSFHGFLATGFMACPSADRSFFQVFARMENATVPTGNEDDCLDFHAVATDFTGGFAAWEYT